MHYKTQNTCSSTFTATFQAFKDAFVAFRNCECTVHGGRYLFSFPGRVLSSRGKENSKLTSDMAPARASLLTSSLDISVADCMLVPLILSLRFLYSFWRNTRKCAYTEAMFILFHFFWSLIAHNLLPNFNKLQGHCKQNRN